MSDDVPDKVLAKASIAQTLLEAGDLASASVVMVMAWTEWRTRARHPLVSAAEERVRKARRGRHGK